MKQQTFKQIVHHLNNKGYWMKSDSTALLSPQKNLLVTDTPMLARVEQPQ